MPCMSYCQRQVLVLARVWSCIQACCTLADQQWTKNPAPRRKVLESERKSFHKVAQLQLERLPSMLRLCAGSPGACSESSGLGHGLHARAACSQRQALVRCLPPCTTGACSPRRSGCGCVHGQALVGHDAARVGSGSPDLLGHSVVFLQRRRGLKRRRGGSCTIPRQGACLMMSEWCRWRPPRCPGSAVQLTAPESCG